ncbi:MAG: 2OG-Fe(II) oxygenase [Deltaproteobacteria bacterium]|nr:2OG-Fe(II) oxygenase [Deltaproteobacteria bacterium]
MGRRSAPQLGALPWWQDGFLSADLCARILDELEITLWRRSTVVMRPGQPEARSVVSGSRTSETAFEPWFSPALRRILRRIEARLEPLLGAERVRMEAWQATRYRRGAAFREHHDAGFGRDGLGGERTRTVILYLDTPSRGGATRFSALDLTVAPNPGRLLTWGNLTPEGACDPRMRHAALPIRAGTKTVLVTWIREHDVRAQRPTRRGPRSEEQT